MAAPVFILGGEQTGFSHNDAFEFLKVADVIADRVIGTPREAGAS